MDHNDRIQIAEQVARKVVASHKKEILVAGLCGSTARNEDLEFSDIDVLFITTNSSPLKGKDFLFRDTQIAIAFTRLRDAQKILKTVDLYWPLSISRFFCIKKLWGDEKILEGLKKIIKDIPEKKFTSELKESVPHTLDLLNKIRNAKQEASLPDALEYVREILYGVNLSLGLLNRKYFTRNYYKNFVEAFEFSKLPADYKRLVNTLWISKDIEEISLLSEKLVANYVRLLKKNGIVAETFSSIDEIPFHEL